MNINQEFIRQVVSSFHAQLSARENLCQMARSELTVEFYKKHVYQELYALRYVPAYYFEYCVLATKLRQRLGNNFHKINIASFGCGLSPDYYALRDNLPSGTFEYVGYDAVQWSSQRFMPPVEDNHSFVFVNVDRLRIQDLADVDVFVFPKSIGDIRNSTPDALVNLAGVISSSPKRRLFFLNSYISKGRNSPVDLGAFKILHGTLLDAGFITADDVEKTFY